VTRKSRPIAWIYRFHWDKLNEVNYSKAVKVSFDLRNCGAGMFLMRPAGRGETDMLKKMSLLGVLMMVYGAYLVAAFTAESASTQEVGAATLFSLGLGVLAIFCIVYLIILGIFIYLGMQIIGINHGFWTAVKTACLDFVFSIIIGIVQSVQNQGIALQIAGGFLATILAIKIMYSASLMEAVLGGLISTVLALVVSAGIVFGIIVVLGITVPGIN
jgi:hypothetical protein